MPLPNPYAYRSIDSLWRYSIHYPIEDKNLLLSTMPGTGTFSAVLGHIWQKFIYEYKRLVDSGATRDQLESFVTNLTVGCRDGGLPDGTASGTVSATRPLDDIGTTPTVCETSSRPPAGVSVLRSTGKKNRRRKTDDEVAKGKEAGGFK